MCHDLPDTRPDPRIASETRGQLACRVTPAQGETGPRRTNE